MARSKASAEWGSGEPIPGSPFRQVVPGAATDGRLVVLAVDMPPGEHVDEHTHASEHQILVVISGEVGASVDGDHVTLTEGSVLCIPPGARHSLWNQGPEAARVLDMYTPAGFERVFEQAGQRVAAGLPPYG
jgi:quercetin dioxygenase-like cupin family protein